MSVSRHAAYNFVGVILPMLLALVTVPLYLMLIGPERYGILAIAWLMLGYFGVFDLGLGRAAAQKIAASMGQPQELQRATFGTAWRVSLAGGVVGALIVWPLVYLLFRNTIDMSASLRAEAVDSAPLLALTVPLAIAIGMLSGALAGRQRFLQINVASVLSTVLFQLLPLLVAWRIGTSLPLLLTASLLARLAGMLIFWRQCAREFGAGAFGKYDRKLVRELLGFGGWVTVSGFVLPVLQLGERFMIGDRLGATSVTHFVVPNQITSRLSPLANALTYAVFPRLSYGEASDRERLYRQSRYTIFVLFTPVMLAGLVLMHPFLALWVGAEIADSSSTLGQCLLLGSWLSIFSQLSVTRLQAEGRPDRASKVQLYEIIPYFFILAIAINSFGLVGAGYAVVLRSFFEAIFFEYQASKSVKGMVYIAISIPLIFLMLIMASLFMNRDLSLIIISVIVPSIFTIIIMYLSPSELKLEIWKRIINFSCKYNKVR